MVFFSSREDAEKSAEKLKYGLLRIAGSDKINCKIIEDRLVKILDNNKLWSAEME